MIRRRSPVARAVRDRLFRARQAQPRGRYRRKPKHPQPPEHGPDA